MVFSLLVRDDFFMEKMTGDDSIFNVYVQLVEVPVLARAPDFEIGSVEADTWN
jgi:hypothetical protein